MMASPHLANLALAWEKYMDTRSQGADLQVSFCGMLKEKLRVNGDSSQATRDCPSKDGHLLWC